jgi:signal transduction histidine kinase
MGERLRQVGGTLTVVTAPGAGTTIRAEVPA